MIERHFVDTAPEFHTHFEELHYRTSHAPQFIDITAEVADAVDRSGTVNGLAVIFSRHTTAAIKINEFEPELLKDMARFLSEVAPIDRAYYHNDFGVRTVNMEADEYPNAHSHCQHLLLNASESVPVLRGRLQLGRWQRIFLVELDRAKERVVSVQVMGL